MLLASIDIGSNAVRLLFANVLELDQQIHVEKATLVRIPVRLGIDVFDKQKISGKRAENLVKTIQAYKILIDVYKPDDYVACATAAMREASNGQDVIKRIRQETGVRVRIIDGIEEADTIRSMEQLPFDTTGKLLVYIDVGGGSTDISVVHGDSLLGVQSFKLGTIRLLEKKDKESEWQIMDEWLRKFRYDRADIICIGTGGNINKINKLYGDPVTKMLMFDRLQYAHQYLSGFSVDDRISLLGLRSDRADVIVPAARIYMVVMKALGADLMYVPKVGLADGLIYNLYKRIKNDIV